ncbi:MAG: SH3 domain-containing protein [Thiovulaceae bacterium]|nr:SH3 domain-containing protein [Sulfurimonadaceae bacterium]
MKYFVLLFVSIFFIACSTTSTVVKISKSSASENKEYMSDDISDLSTFSQTSSAYLEKQNIKGIEVDIDTYEKNYFKIWNEIPLDTKELSMWPFSSYKYGEMYGENLQLVEEEIFKKLEDMSNFEKYKTVNKNAITLDHLNIRAFPTLKPMFKDPKIAGEGFPFDYLQNSTISANKPILISHYSKDKRWAFIFTSFTSGWVESKDIIVLDKQYTDIWQKAKQIFIIKDNVALYDENKNFLFKSRVGMIMPLIEEDNFSYTVLSVSVYKNDEPNYHKTKIPKSISSKGLLTFNNKNIQDIFDEVSKSKYGWGGMYGQRDCSSTVRDIYTPFGIWLPRNSSQQSKIGKVISFENLDDKQKRKLIKKEAVPFKTLFYKKGHILIYVGIINDEIIAFHNVWGVKTKDKNNKEGRIVVGKSVYSSLSLGSNLKNYDKDAEILKNLVSMNILSN